MMTSDLKDIFDPEAIKTDPRTECNTRIESQLLIDLEAQYWSLLELQFIG